MSLIFQKSTEGKHILKTREMLKELPGFIAEYFRGISDSTLAHTRMGYAYDLRIFFAFLSEEHLNGKEIKSITTDDMKIITTEILETFMEYLTYYIRTGEKDTVIRNESRGKSRKLAAVRGMFKFLRKKNYIENNPAELISFPKLREKNITTLEADEVAKLLDEVDSGDKLSKKQKHFHEITKLRDSAIITLLLGTGIRVSECVGIDINHIDFNINGIKIIRKGGDESVIYFGEEVNVALQSYLIERSKATPEEPHENALFLSIQNKRITTRAVQNLVKKYSALTSSLKNISPHKLRSTYGTSLYRETGDIYLVASVLGHADVNTTKKHYAKLDDEKKRRAANIVRLRD